MNYKQKQQITINKHRKYFKQLKPGADTGS